MLDRKFIVDNADAVQQNCQNRGVTADVAKLVQLEQERREKLNDVQDLNRQANEKAKSIGKEKDPDKRQAIIEEGRRLRDAKDKVQQEHDTLEDARPDRLRVGSSSCRIWILLPQK